MAHDGHGPDSKLALADRYQKDLMKLLSAFRNIDHGSLSSAQMRLEDNVGSLEVTLTYFIERMRQIGEDQNRDADALERLRDKIFSSPSYGGLGLTASAIPTEVQYQEILFLTEAFLESVNSQLRTRNFLQVSRGRLDGKKPMTLAQKIFTQHALSGVAPGSGSLDSGDVIRVGIDWVLASELSWSGMSQAHEELGSPGIWRNDRLWIAGDHVVHPTIVDNPKIKVYIDKAEKAKRDFKMTEYQGMNYTIMHTEFVRERAEPGMLLVGSDSHTCSAGAVGCLAIGLGTVDVMITLSLGETWFKVPESILIELEGTPSFAISGKDIILHILKQLKRNTVAAERIVEFTGEGVQHLSCDARFAICNMCAEFGAITGVFVPDSITQEYIQRRRGKAYKSGSIYFKPDLEAHYAARCTIDLSAVEPYIAVYPEPDNVVPVSEKAGLQLDGVFIGACTTTEEELVLGALVLKVGLEMKLPMVRGKRHYVPGSLPIVEKLRELKLLEVYEAAGFTRGPPGCSMCVGLTAEKAAEGETWLSSQNRNFQNRMGKGSFGHLSSAAVCAASSFSMTITNPTSLLQYIDIEFFAQYKDILGRNFPEVSYGEPMSYKDNSSGNAETAKHAVSGQIGPAPIIESKIVVLGDFIDTDALSPGFTLTTCKNDEEFGQHVLCYTHPDFREKVKSGQRVVVAGNAFGVGSSRETAVSALIGAGVQAVIARSFAFIYGRNQPSRGLLGIVMKNEDFYETAREGEAIKIDLEKRVISVGAETWPFDLSEIEYKLTLHKGISETYKLFGKAIWEKLIVETSQNRYKEQSLQNVTEIKTDGTLEW